MTWVANTEFIKWAINMKSRATHKMQKRTHSNQRNQSIRGQ